MFATSIRYLSRATTSVVTVNALSWVQKPPGAGDWPAHEDVAPSKYCSVAPYASGCDRTAAPAATGMENVASAISVKADRARIGANASNEYTLREPSGWLTGRLASASGASQSLPGVRTSCCPSVLEDTQNCGVSCLSDHGREDHGRSARRDLVWDHLDARWRSTDARSVV